MGLIVYLTINKVILGVHARPFSIRRGFYFGHRLRIRRKRIRSLGSTNRGATIDKLIDILQKKDLSQYETVVHISGNDFHNADSLNVIYEKYESLLCQLLVMCQPDTVIMVVLTLCPDSPQFRHDHLLTVNRRQKFPCLSNEFHPHEINDCSLIRFGHRNDGCDQ
jgi:hypothetical protein